jgi:uncharacterized membrane protein
MSENLEDVIRNSLDSVEKRHKRFLVFGTVFAFLAVLFLVAMAVLVDVRPQNLENLSRQMMLGFDGLCIVIVALCCYLMSISQRNTRAILKAISMLSGSKPD